MSASTRWELAACLLMVVGINTIAAYDGWLGLLGGGIVGGAIACLGESTSARVTKAQKDGARRLASLLRGGPR